MARLLYQLKFINEQRNAGGVFRIESEFPFPSPLGTERHIKCYDTDVIQGRDLRVIAYEDVREDERLFLMILGWTKDYSDGKFEQSEFPVIDLPSFQDSMLKDGWKLVEWAGL